MVAQRPGWGEFRDKPVFSPSRLMDYTCLLRFKLRHLDHLMAKISYEIRAEPAMGTLLHAAEEAIDRELMNNPQNPDWDAWKEGLDTGTEELVERFPEEIRKRVLKGPLIQQLREEASLIMRGGFVVDGRGKRNDFPSYKRWLLDLQKRHDFEIIATEERYYEDVGPIILAPKLDLVIRDSNGYWVVERKSTGRDDSEWKTQWRLNHQILIQIRAAEEHFNVRFQGAMVRQILLTRQNTKAHREGKDAHLPQPLNKVVRADPRWIRKDPTSNALFEESLADVRSDWDERVKTGNWPASGIHRGSCRFCEFQAYCRGEYPFKQLVPRKLDEVGAYVAKREQAAETRKKKAQRRVKKTEKKAKTTKKRMKKKKAVKKGTKSAREQLDLDL